MQQKVILLGHGNVGKTFIKQVLKYDSIRVGRHNNPTVIMGVASKDKILFNHHGLRSEDLNKIIENNDLGKDAKQISSSLNIIDIVDNAGLNGEIIFADATGSKDEMRDFHLAVMEQTDNGIVTANKNPISLYDYDVYKRLTKNLRYQYTTTVMAGSGIVRFLRGTRKISDKIHSISGIFSGTLGFITGELDKGKKISEIVRMAHKIGYTEPSPWDDLNGLDVARKLVILARASGFRINIEDINISPLLPSRFGEISNLEDFLKEIESEDENIGKKVKKAQENGNVLRYSASLKVDGDKVSLCVGLEEVKKDSPLGKLSGPANFVEVITDLYNRTSPFILQSPGAGLEVTAGSLRKDMLSFLPRLENVKNSKYK